MQLQLEQFQDSTGSVIFKWMRLLTDIYEVPTLLGASTQQRREIDPAV